MSAFDRAWLVVKAPLDLDSIRELGPEYQQALEQRRALIDELDMASERPHERLDEATYLEQNAILPTGIQNYTGHGFAPKKGYDRTFHATHTDREGMKYPMVAYVEEDGGANINVYPPREAFPRYDRNNMLAPRSPFFDTLEHPVGTLSIFPESEEPEHDDTWFWDGGGRGDAVRRNLINRKDTPDDTRVWLEGWQGDRWGDAEDIMEYLRGHFSDYDMTGSALGVEESWRRRGIATAMRDLASELALRGMPIDNRPDLLQSYNARDLWAHNQGDPDYRNRLHEIEWRGLRERQGDEQA